MITFMRGQKINKINSSRIELKGLSFFKNSSKNRYKHDQASNSNNHYFKTSQRKFKKMQFKMGKVYGINK